MKCEKYLGNYNFEYEWESSKGEWYPCHIYKDSNFAASEGSITIYTRNGTIMDIKKDKVRKMSEKDYLQHKQKILSFVGPEHMNDVGF